MPLPPGTCKHGQTPDRYCQFCDNPETPSFLPYCGGEHGQHEAGCIGATSLCGDDISTSLVTGSPVRCVLRPEHWEEEHRGPAWPGSVAYWKRTAEGVEIRTELLDKPTYAFTQQPQTMEAPEPVPVEAPQPRPLDRYAEGDPGDPISVDPVTQALVDRPDGVEGRPALELLADFLEDRTVGVSQGALFWDRSVNYPNLTEQEERQLVALFLARALELTEAEDAQDTEALLALAEPMPEVGPLGDDTPRPFLSVKAADLDLNGGNR